MKVDLHSEERMKSESNLNSTNNCQQMSQPSDRLLSNRERQSTDDYDVGAGELYTDTNKEVYKMDYPLKKPKKTSISIAQYASFIQQQNS